MRKIESCWNVWTFQGALHWVIGDATVVVAVVESWVNPDDFNKAEAVLEDGTKLTLDKNGGQYTLYAKSSNVIEQEVDRIAPKKSEWIFVEEDSQVIGSRYLVVEESSGSPSCKVRYESYFDDVESAQYYADYYKDYESPEGYWKTVKLYLIIAEDEGRAKALELESFSC